MSQIYLKKFAAPAGPNSESSRDLLTEALNALGITGKEAEVYKYFFHYGPADLDKTETRINFPKNVTHPELLELAEKLEKTGYIKKTPGGYQSTSLEFLIQTTSLNPRFAELNQKLKQWKQKSIE